MSSTPTAVMSVRLQSRPQHLPQRAPQRPRERASRHTHPSDKSLPPARRQSPLGQAQSSHSGGWPGARAARMTVLLALAGCAVLMLAGPLQQPAQAQKKLEPEDYGQWQSVGSAELSPEGDWFAYTISLIEGDGWLMVHPPDGEPGEGEKFMHGENPAFSADNTRLAFRIGLSEETERQMREQDERIKYDVGVMHLADSRVDTFANVRSYSFSGDGRFLALEKYRPEDTEHRGRDLVLRDLDRQTSHNIGNVAEYAFNEQGEQLAYVVDAYDKLGNGVHLVDLPAMSTRVLDSEEKTYRGLTWNEQGTGLAFQRSQDLDGYEEDSHRVMAFTGLDTGSPERRVFDQTRRADFPEEHRIVSYRSLQWSDDGDRLFFGIKEATPEEEEQEARGEKADQRGEQERGDDADAKDEKEEDPDAHLDPSNVEIWHWQDDQTQPRQQVLERQLLESNLLSVWHLDQDRFVQLTDNHEHSLSLTGDQRHAVLYDPQPYQPRFRENWRDVYLVNVASGERSLVVERQESVQASPGGDYLLYFRQGDWHSYDIREGRHVNLTEDLDPRFNNFNRVTGREFDPPFGSGQWAEGDEWVLIYDEFDVHRLAPDGGHAERLTEGRDREVRYRQQRLDWEDEALDPGEPFYLSMFGEPTKERGYARVAPDGAVQTLIYQPAMITRLGKADESPSYIYQRQTATDSPDFYRTGRSFGDAERLTATNPQQDDYHWAGDELVRFTNERGEQLEGRLLYPAGYDPDKEYPMLVYIYEERSQTLHNYSMPSRTSAYNQRRYSSEGYFVFEPDITYENHQPGMSAVESVVPAVERVLETGMIDEDRIGLTGHSWGGYQTNHIITQTDLFSSAVSGAPLTNMVSMYNSVYWRTGNTNASIFETSQGRLPDPWWDDWENYLQNSPIHQMDEDMDTPLLLMFGTDDGAVDFNQGVELYNAMRRMQNEFVMLVYESELHSLQRRENQIDYAERAFQWHEHYLNGEQAPGWIEQGLPHIDRPEMQDRR